jgi:hypothetical protein
MYLDVAYSRNACQCAWYTACNLLCYMRPTLGLTPIWYYKTTTSSLINKFMGCLSHWHLIQSRRTAIH